MKEIPLTQGQVALVDDEDFEWLSQWKWCASRGATTFYAVRSTSRKTPPKRRIWMHRAIMGVTDIAMEVDHINGEGLDNRRANLRTATHQQNSWNVRRPRDNWSGFKGITRTPQHRWAAGIVVRGKGIHLGNYDTPDDAARAYDGAARHYFGEFARLNFPGLVCPLPPPSRRAACEQCGGEIPPERRRFCDKRCSQKNWDQRPEQRMKQQAYRDRRKRQSVRVA